MRWLFVKKNPIEVCDYIKREFSAFISSTYTVDDLDYQKQLDRELKSIDIFNGPFLHSNLPFVKDKNITELVQEQILSKEFLKLSTLDLKRPLYWHQVQAIKKAKEGKNLVITTGTGSGKTESFLYPVLNEIMEMVSNKTKEKGVKAIFLYPMNALVNDQRERIRNILRNYPDITFGSFTGETPEKLTAKDTMKLRAELNTELLENELYSRDQIRKEIPDLLFTNYSMLEYLLIRPEDYALIKPENMKQWQFLILDEAHSYKGTLGIELAMLLRRLSGFAERNPQYILTSATLGDKNSVGDIVRFAENLTSAHFDESSVVFGERKNLNFNNIQYKLDKDIYPQLFANIRDRQKLRELCGLYCDTNGCYEAEGMIYRLLLHDENCYTLYKAIDKTDTYDHIKEKLNENETWTDEQLVSLIQCISLANDEGNTLYDAKFHLFVSAPNRAFITIGKQKKIKFGNHKFIDGYKAFEMGMCKNCKQIYIMGKIVNGKLETDDIVDIYENYDEQSSRKLDFFMLQNEEDEECELDKYMICSKCGNVVEVNNLNAVTCNCGDEYQVPVYKINNENSEKKNNITRCAHCGQSNTSGILHSFNVNKDTATSVLSQIYYQAIGNDSEKKEESPNMEIIDLFSDAPIQPKKTKKDYKQLLAFSDSRQQASFFSVYCNYQNERFLRRRLVWEEIKNQDEIPVKTLAFRLMGKIREKDLFNSENYKAQSEAWIAILYDILLADGQYSSEGLGLFSYVYDIDDTIPQIKSIESQIQSLFGLNVDDFITLIRYVIYRFRSAHAVDYSMAELSDQEKKDAFQYVDRDAYYVIKKVEKDSNPTIKSFLPVKAGSVNHVMSYIMKVCDCSKENAQILSEKLFSLMRNLKMFKTVNSEGYEKCQLNLNQFKVKNHKKQKWYICSKCRKLTLYNIKNKCPQKDCDGILEECNVDEYFANNYYRKEYMNKTIEKIVVKEHTAQLNKEKAREYQREFKNKEINILSCSTTFEMGVDIGSLENVFLRNMPPTPANYVQRAGRAGRSKDAAALIVTYCGNKSHDYSYFVEPKKMIEGVIMPPMFEVVNKKIILRHILASAFGFYFRRHNADFHDAQNFIYNTGMEEFIHYISNKPEKLGQYVDNKILYSKGMEGYRNYRWLDDVLSEDSKLTVFIKEMLHKQIIYEEAMETAKRENNLELAGYFKNQLELMKKDSVISLLSKNAVIPKYGFPVDVVDLKIITKERIDPDYNLQRDLGMAISEYAPNSEVVVDGNKYVSRYINLPKKNSGDLPRYYYYVCPNCNQTMISLTPFIDDSVCSNCQAPINSKTDYFVIPQLGFSTDRTQKKSRTMRPEKTFAGTIKYIGEGSVENEDINFKDKFTLSVINNDKLVAINEHPFYTCPECGYTELKNGVFTPRITQKKNHYTCYGRPCPNKVLERVAIGHVFTTDVVKITLNQDVDKNELITTVFALLEGMSHCLQIERTDINGLVVGRSNQKHDIILFDSVPGGAGHVKRLADLNLMQKVLESAYEIVNRNCCDEETTCTNCLRNYYNQPYHGIMKRKYARDLLKNLLGK